MDSIKHEEYGQKKELKDGCMYYYEGKSVNKSQKAMKKILSEIFT
jgi:hypothetical protein